MVSLGSTPESESLPEELEVLNAGPELSPKELEGPVVSALVEPEEIEVPVDVVSPLPVPLAAEVFGSGGGPDVVTVEGPSDPPPSP